MTESHFISARPRFLVNGSAHAALNESAVEVISSQPLSGRAQLEARFINWGREEGEPDFRLQDVALGDKIEVLFSEQSDSPQFTGEVTALEERYGSGAPQLVLLAEDELHRLARRRASRSFEDSSVDDVIASVVSDAGLRSDASVAQARATWHQLNESDLAFLLRLLRPFDVALRIVAGSVRARLEETDVAPISLDPHSNAKRMRITVDLNHQRSVSGIAGWDPAADSETSATSDALQPAPRGQVAQSIMTDLGWAGEEAIAHPFAFTQSLADAYAVGAFRRSARRFLYGQIDCNGMPAISVGREVELDGVSSRLLGKYQVVLCRHLFDRVAGYSTSLGVERPDWES